MRRPLAVRSTPVVLVGIVVVLLAAGGGYAIARSRTKTIRACVRHGTHMLYAAPCHRGDRRITWNTVGPRGAAGPKGATGASGAPGQNGAAGSPGIVSNGGWAGAVGTNATFFAGSIFFTAAALIQLSLSGRSVPHRDMSRPDLIDWWAAAIQFAGTLLFNLSTGSALVAAVDCKDAWVEEAREDEPVPQPAHAQPHYVTA